MFPILEQLVWNNEAAVAWSHLCRGGVEGGQAHDARGGDLLLQLAHRVHAAAQAGRHPGDGHRDSLVGEGAHGFDA